MIVHWQLIASLQSEKNRTPDPLLKKTVLSPSWVEEVSSHLNAKNRNAKSAQKDSTELFETLYILNETKTKPLIMTGVISDVRGNGFMMFIPQ